MKANGEGTVYQRKDGYYVAAWVDNGKRKVAYAKTKTAARDKLKKALRRMDDNQPSVDSRMPFRGFAALWSRDILPNARDRHGKPLTAGSIANYANVMRLHVVPVLGDLTLNQITEHDVEVVLATMANKGLSTAYQNQAHKSMARLFRDAKKMRLLAVIPMEDVPAPAETYKDKIVPDSDQVRQLMDSAPTQRMATFITGLAFTGLRISELLGAKWTDLNDDMTALTVMGKGSRPRTVPVAAALKDELVKWRRDLAKQRLQSPWWSDEGWLLPSDCGTRWETRNARKRFKPLADAVLPGITPHSLRHAAATMLLEEHIPMKVVAELLGHTSTRVTEQTYSHVTQRLVTQSADALQARLGEM